MYGIRFPAKLKILTRVGCVDGNVLFLFLGKYGVDHSDDVYRLESKGVYCPEARRIEKGPFADGGADGIFGIRDHV